MLEIRISKIRFVTKSSNFVFKKKMRKLTKSDIHFDEMSFSFRIIVIILQKIDHLIQKKWLRAVSSIMKKWRKKSISRNEKFESKKWQIIDEILHYENKMYISANAFQKELLRLHHNDSQIEHFDYEKILKLIKRKYFWSKMTADIKEYVIVYSNCVKIKISKHKSYELLQFLSISQKSKQD